MSEQTVHDGDIQQTDVRGFLRKLKRGEPLCSAATTQLLDRIYNILEGIAGEGCSIEKPLDRDGLGWKVVMDGQTSDLEPDVRVPMPFELVSVNNSWHVWTRDADVAVNYYRASKAPDLLLSESGAYTAGSFGVGPVYLFVTPVPNAAHAHGANCYRWSVGPSVPTGAICSVHLATVVSATSATQYARGNQLLFTHADSDIIVHDNANATLHIPTTDTSNSSPPITDKLCFVVRYGGIIRYWPVTELLEMAVDLFAEAVGETQDPETPESDLLPIGDETQEEWKDRIKDRIAQCLEEDGYPYQPALDEIDLAAYPNAPYFCGYGPDGGWVGVTDADLRRMHLPSRADYEEILRLLGLIKARMDAVETPAQTLHETISDTLSTMTTLTSLLATVKASASTLAGDVQYMNGEISSLNSRIAALRARYTAIEHDVSTLEGQS